MKICIIIPVYNESKAIGQIVSKLKALNLDAVVIDDGSTDNSGRIAEDNGANVIRHEKRNGKGYSVQQGFAYAKENGYDGVVTMDGDGQHDTGDLPGIIQMAQQHPDSVIIGNRMDDTKGMPGLRLITNRYMSFLISSICKQKIEDTQCGFRYIGTKILKEINLTCDAFEIESEVLIKASRKGYKVYSVPVKTIYRDEDSKINPLKDTFRFAVYIMKELFAPKQ